jgi:Uma2 family endonuclease
LEGKKRGVFGQWLKQEISVKLKLGETMAVNPHIKFTYEDYKNIPESENQRYELLGGELYMAPAPIPYHQHISKRLFHCLYKHVRENDSGEVYYSPIDVRLSNEDVVQPDILFIAKDRLSIIHEDAIHGAPDLLLEILSPATAERDRTLKKTLYARSGVKEFWIVDPITKTIEVFSLAHQGYQLFKRFKIAQKLRSPTLAHLEITLREIF